MVTFFSTPFSLFNFSEVLLPVALGIFYWERGLSLFREKTCDNGIYLFSISLGLYFSVFILMTMPLRETLPAFLCPLIIIRAALVLFSVLSFSSFRVEVGF
jgi:hypothetical protein